MLRERSPIAASILASLVLISPAAGAVTAVKWEQLSPTDSPPPRKGHVAVHDPDGNQIIVIGGEGDGITTCEVWVFKNGNWIDLTSRISGWEYQQNTYKPVAREDHSAIYDPVDNRVLVFGGEAESAPSWPSGFPALCDADTILCDTWALSLEDSSWTLLDPVLTTGSEGEPICPREGHTAVYDAGTDRMVVFGGVVVYDTGSGTFANTGNDAWALTFTRSLGIGGWSRLSQPPSGGGANCSPVPPPPADCACRCWELVSSQDVCMWGQSGYWPKRRWYQAAAIDGDHRMHIFGGSYTADPQVWNNTDVMDLGGSYGSWWTPRDPMPNTLENLRVFHDPETDHMYVFGGGDEFEDPSSNSNITYRFDVDAEEWHSGAFPSCSAPPSRGWHTLTYDPPNRRAVLFGGEDVNGDELGDTWVFDLEPHLLSEMNEAPAMKLKNCITVKWTSPAIDRCGLFPTTMYEIRYSTSPISNETDWQNAAQVTAPAPSSPGTIQSVTIMDLSPCTTYHVVVRALGEEFWSPIGQGLSVQTSCSGAQCLGESAAREVHPELQPATFRIDPNPATGYVRIRFSRSGLAGGEPVEIRIYDISGRTLARLQNVRTGRGGVFAEWDLKDDSGEVVAPGVYFVRLREGERILDKTLLVRR